MKPTPAGWPRISTSLYYDDADAAIDWLCRAFGFELQLKVAGDDGKVVHSELVFGGGLIMVSETAGNGKETRMPYIRTPSQVGGGNTQNMMVYVDDVDAHCARARAAGAKIHAEPKTTDYGEEYWTDKAYACEDIGGHHWWFQERLRSGTKA